jgi:hypothetical protein
VAKTVQGKAHPGPVRRMGSALAKPTARQALWDLWRPRDQSPIRRALCLLRVGLSPFTPHPHPYPIGFVSTRGSSRCNSLILWIAACTSASVNSALMATLAW